MKIKNLSYLLNYFALAGLVVAVLLVSIFKISFTPRFGGHGTLVKKVTPEKGVELAVSWGDLGKQMLETGVIDETKFIELYEQRGGLGEEETQLLYDDNTDKIRLTTDNASYLLNLLWGLGISNQTTILDTGPIQDYGDASRFAATGGWLLSTGSPMDHFSAHNFLPLTTDQEQLVAKVAENIYRPCCNNSTHFPDCNHGMAMLGYLELLAVNGLTEDEMYEEALKLNSFWFPSSYVNIAQLYADSGTKWNKVDPKEILGMNFSSSAGYARVLQYVQPQNSGGGNSCSV